MPSAVKKTDFSEYQQTLSVITNFIDKELQTIKGRQKNLPVWHGHKSFKYFLKDLEKKALKNASEEMGLAATTVRDRWSILTLPFPVYAAIEDGDISLSKAKPLTKMNFDFESENDASIAMEIVERIKNEKLSINDIKAMVEEKSSQVWNESTIVVQRVAEQNGVYSDSKF